MTTTLAYKVIYRGANDGFYSAVAVGDLCVHYKVGEYVSSPFGPLFVFATLEDAIDFGGRDRDAEVWYAEVQNMRDCPPMVLGPEIVFDADLARKFWRDPNVYTGPLVYVPRGTKIADAVKLLEKR
ncbi:MAG: hypothetical protein QXE45_04555 [Thermoplasmata archaeon]